MNSIPFLKYLTDETTDKEKEEFYNTLKEDKELEKEFLSIKKIWDLAQLQRLNLPFDTKKQLFLEFWEKNLLKKRGVRRNIARNILRYAAIVMLLTAFPLIYILGRKSAIPTESFSTITCAPGDKTSIILPDSTLVCLNSGSKLIFNTNFEKGEREVYIEGEAYFKVTRDKENPFKVKSTDIEVEVLGTEFNFKAYPEEENTSVTLIEGSVKVSGGNQSVQISPNQKLVYNRITNKMVREKLMDTSPETEWKEGRLVFRNESLGELELELERWFDVDIDFSDELVKKRRFTGILERESILEAISYFGYSKFVGYKIEGNEITFYTKN